MKRLFKNLMLVAVAAMAFVACSQDNDSINILAKKTVLHFNAGFADDTRSSFVEKEDGATSYKSVWNGGEQLIISICDSEGNEVGSAYAYVSLDEDIESAESMHFSAEYGGEIPENGSITVYSGNWFSDYYSGKYVPYFNSEQYGATDYSVASDYHICKSNTVEFTNGLPATIDLTFSTAVAFGKITMSQFSDIADKIEEVKVTINDNTTYTVTPATLTKPVVWFAAEAVEAVTKLSIEAKVDGVTYVKTAENLTTSFETGLVRPINVSAMTEKPADYNIEFTKMVFEGEAMNGGYLYTFTNESDSESMSLAFNPAYGNPLQAGTYECCFWFNGDNYDFNGNDSILIIDGENYYPTVGSKIIVELNESVYTIKANLVVGEKTAACTFTGEISEPEIPAFTSAKITNTVMYDKFVQFTSNELGTLQLNFYNCNDNNWIDARTYTFANSGEIYPGGSYSWYKDIDGTERYAVNGTVVVTIVNGKYHIEFSNITDYDGSYTLNAVYEGEIEGLIVPDLREPLATPEPTFVLDGKNATISWESIPGAVAYRVFTQNNELNETITETSITLNFVEYGEYYINVKAVAAADDSTYQDSNAAVVRILIEDPRQYLPVPTNVTATIDGPNATISWDAVEGADGYQVFYYLNGENRVDVKEATITLEVGYDVSNLWVYVFSIANDDNLEYRSSTSWDASVEVNTGKDPNVFADHILDKVTVKSDHIEFYREYVGDGTQHSANTTESLRIYLHANNRGNDYISTGEYTCVGAGASVPPSAGTVNMRYTSDSYWYYHSNANTNSTLSVSFVNNEYVIIATINGETWGYKGMPEDWVAPGGGEEPEQPGEGGGDEPGEGGGDEPDGTVNNPYVFTNCTYAPGQYVKLHFSGSEDGAELTLESNTGYGLPEGVVSLSNNGWWYSGHSYSLGDINYGSSYTSIDKNADGSYKINYIMINSNGKNTYYIYNENIL